LLFYGKKIKYLIFSCFICFCFIVIKFAKMYLAFLNAILYIRSIEFTFSKIITLVFGFV